MDLFDLSLVQQAASAPEQVLHSAAPEALREECPPDMRAIPSWIVASMEGSEPEDLLERTLSGQEKRAKALVTHLFPGRVWWGPGSACRQALST